ncbi:TRADD-N-associated membrane domain-containing protein [Nocardia nova]|uniref:TRADD-N-associated membrane domain-containing protein n=1 Tax=Nocardia nova TaxID=37330 RepID=UPI00189558D8|nr:hypothetical protein [Nocardia nova]MBF6144209.1 hypothetical protein [Nocardia nova]
MDEAFERALKDNRPIEPADLMAAVRKQLLDTGKSIDDLAPDNLQLTARLRRIAHGDHPRLPSHPAYLNLIVALGIVEGSAEYELWHRAYHDVERGIRRRRQSQQVVVTGNNAKVKVVGEASASVSNPPLAKLPEQRQEFYFRFLGNALLQANIAFVLAMLFTAAGACVTVWGVVMLVMRAGASSATNYIPLIMTLSGFAVACGGGAFAVHASKARAHVATRADRVHEDIQGDVAFERATALIDRVSDPELKDRLLSLTAVKELGLSPAPIDLTKHLPTKRIEGAQETKVIEAGEGSGTGLPE